MTRIAQSLAALAAGGIAVPPPAGLGRMPVPRDNPMTAAKVELGRRLIHDADLSVDGTMACGTCHEQHRAFSDGNATHAGVHGEPGRRNVPGLANVAWLRTLTWADPRQRSLEGQAEVPVMGATPVEMGMAGEEAEITRRLTRDACYPTMFARAFPSAGVINFRHVAMALAAFERTLVSIDSPYDTWRRGDRAALPSDAVAGERLFRQACSGCHSGPLLSDGRFHALLAPDPKDLGLEDVTRRPRDADRFRTPSLRNVALTAPYLHDGSELRRSPASSPAPGSGQLVCLRQPGGGRFDQPDRSSLRYRRAQQPADGSLWQETLAWRCSRSRF